MTRKKTREEEAYDSFLDRITEPLFCTPPMSSEEIENEKAKRQIMLAEAINKAKSKK